MAAVLDGGKCHSDDDYEDPELQLLKAWPSMKILPAKPIQESEYAGIPGESEDACPCATLHSNYRPMLQNSVFCMNTGCPVELTPREFL